KDWHNVEELLDSVEIVVAHRESELELASTIAHRYIDNVSIHISSSDIRNRIKTGKAFRYIIPEKVYEYIVEKDLYK
ncbi:MAG: nicotinate (nicotinamide) nucleotide adenylyltransferase, partial [Bacteroidetes bacterium]